MVLSIDSDSLLLHDYCSLFHFYRSGRQVEPPGSLDDIFKSKRFLFKSIHFHRPEKQFSENLGQNGKKRKKPTLSK